MSSAHAKVLYFKVQEADMGQVKLVVLHLDVLEAGMNGGLLLVKLIAC